MVEFKYCPYCKGHLRESKSFYVCKSCKEIIYKHSSLTGSVFIVKDNKVLLAKRAWKPKKGYYDVVGGFLEYGETPEEGAKREALEETGAKVKIIKLLGIYPDSYKYNGRIYKTINPIYVGKLLGNKIEAKDDVAELKWFLIDSLPKNIAFKSGVKGLKDLKKWFKSGRG